MENIALSDSNDDLAGDIGSADRLARPPPGAQDDQQHVASELHDAATTDVLRAPSVGSGGTPFKPLFPPPGTLGRSPIGGSPLLFQHTQQKTSDFPTINPLLHPPTSAGHLPSPLIQANIRPAPLSSAFQTPSSAFTPLNPNNNSTPPLSSLIQPKMTIGSQQPPFSSPSQPVHFPLPRLPTPQGTMPQGVETTSAGPPPMMMAPPSVFQDVRNATHPPLPAHDIFMPQQESQFPQFLPPKDSQVPPPPPPPTQATAVPPSSASANPYSARASLSERIYPAMPTSHAPLQPQQLPPPAALPQQVLTPGNVFVPPMPPTNTGLTVDNVYPATDPSIYNPSYQQPGNYNPTSPWMNYPPTSTQEQQQQHQQQNDQSISNTAGIWGWISNNKMLATVVEKAKTGIETVITTVDPQMKQYIQPGHEVHLVVTSAKDVKLTPVRDAFTHVFGRATTQGIGVQSNVAPQPVGFEAGFKGAQQRIENLRRQNVVRPDQCVVSIENFIAELVPDMYFDLGYVLLSDPLNSIELHLFTQAIPVPIEYVYQARDRTPADYPLRWSGYLVTIGEILHSQLPFVNPEDWHEMMSGTSRRDIIYATCKSLAYMYKQRLNRQ